MRKGFGSSGRRARLHDGIWVCLEVQPPGRLGRTPAIHGHRDHVGPILAVADDHTPRLAAAPAHGGDPQGAPFAWARTPQPLAPSTARTIDRCTCQAVTTNHRGGKRAFPSAMPVPFPKTTSPYELRAAGPDHGRCKCSVPRRPARRYLGQPGAGEQELVG